MVLSYTECIHQNSNIIDGIITGIEANQRDSQSVIWI